MRDMKGQNDSLRLGLEILTPVQTGTGGNLIQHIDYIDLGGQVFMVDQARTFAALATGDQTLDAVLSGARLDDLVRLAGARHGQILPSLHGAPGVPREFRAQLKDAFLRPYLPGTALKGAIRTALFAAALRRLPDTTWQHLLPAKHNKPTPYAKKAAQELSKQVFGANPNQDRLRALHVGDALYQPDDLRLADIRWLNLIGPAKPYQARWRNMATRTSVHRWQDAPGLYAEMLAPGTLAPVTLQWDRFLLSDPVVWGGRDGLPGILPVNFEALRQVLNDHARHRLEREIDFYRTYRQDGPLQQCLRLLALLEREPDAAYLQLAWGSGWRGMTGDWLAEEERERLRGLYREMRGRDGMPFPKTRRLAVWNHQPCLPLGWLRLLPWEAALRTEAGQAHAHRAAEARKTEAQARQRAEEAEQAARAEAERQAQRAALSEAARAVEDFRERMARERAEWVRQGISGQWFQALRALAGDAAGWEPADRARLRELVEAIGGLAPALAPKKNDHIKKLLRSLAP
ncbi:MAG: type III-A CRISPR-associated RAMP protein Csm5 [Methylococcus sp.]